MKSLGGDLAIWTVLWAAAGAFLAYEAFRDGKPGLAVVYTVLTVASVCLWFGIRQAKWPLVAYFAVATVGGLALLVTRGPEWRVAAHIAVGLYSIYLLVRWNAAPPDDGASEVHLSPAARRVLAYLQSPEGQAEIEQDSREREEVCRWDVIIELPSGQPSPSPAFTTRPHDCRIVPI